MSRLRAKLPARNAFTSDTPARRSSSAPFDKERSLFGEREVAHVLPLGSHVRQHRFDRLVDPFCVHVKLDFLLHAADQAHDLGQRIDTESGGEQRLDEEHAGERRAAPRSCN